MKFADAKEYFRKLHNILSAIILVPVLSFGYIYLEAGYANNPMSVPAPADVRTYLLAFALVTLVAWSVATFLRRLKEIRQLELLTDRLSGYASAVINRFAVASLGGLAGVAGLYLTSDPIHVGLFVLVMIMLSAWWPSASRVCRHLKLGKEEREWVMKRAG
ncbi:MAG: hypothetical protein DIU61_002695 [Bacteroidota bacterium]|jgi:ABC-type dipeptide/oligopeptide/nickel transport system permease subunit|nr:MAG: hypothetical protein DIU61_08345 [Bacteroidota bacterium]